ncbi:PqqD family protein [Paracoccus sp. JM45]|uniref:PqqD family protein n=1 Tax=Paracoccus sp. JM45 TaxID=2283626 RepID=UPI000E6C8668|nr:PqqD family protein [Paracoccus sp. JM45]RJE78705.1 PqqD family protein [Paracoccus sp. JM45]
MTYLVSPECVSCAVDDGIAILDLRSNTYFSLDAVGTSIWNRMSNPASLNELTDAISAEYAVTPEECRGDISDLLNDMLEHDLIQAV